MAMRFIQVRTRLLSRWLGLAACVAFFPGSGPDATLALVGAPDVGVAAQYGSTHVYVSPADVDRFVHSFLATFGGQSSQRSVVTATPTPSRATSQLLQTPVGMVSLFGFETPVPYPFGSERTGYLVADLDAAVRAARTSGADVVVEPFADAVGRDAVVEWPGGVEMQLYWHTTTPSYPALVTVPENRVYVSRDRIDAFVRDFVAFSRGKVTSDDPRAAGAEIGRPADTFRRVEINSLFGKVAVFATDGHLPFPYGRERTGYEVADFAGTMERAKASGAAVLVEPYTFSRRQAAMVEFPGGYIAEIHGAR
jgi:hypothetical protein